MPTVQIGTKTVAVGCPFCKVVVGDSVAQVGGDDAPPVMDVAEILLAAVQSARPKTAAATPTADISSASETTM